MVLVCRITWGRNVAFFRTEEEIDEFVALNGLEGQDCECEWVIL